LVMPHDSLFNEQQRDAKASVVLKLKRRILSEEAGDSIRNLVAGAVDDLRPENVVLLDTLGRPLGRKGGSAETEAHEQELATKLVETLEPVAGVGNVRASVNVEYDTSTADEVDETYDPNDIVTLSMQRSEQTSGGQPVASGVPGTASNAPNTQPPVYPRSASELQSQKQESGTYGASKKVRHTTQGVGRLRRITAAVLINQVLINGRQPVWQARSPEQMKHLTELAQATVGYDATRGDVVSVEDLPFDEQTAPEAPFGERLLRTASLSEPLLKYGTILLAIAGLFFFIVRPVMRKVQEIPNALVQVKPADALLASGSTETVSGPEKIIFDQQRLQAQSVFDSVTDHLRREPAQSTRLLQSWIHGE
jgi:flagellar M-ring protein FliF